MHIFKEYIFPALVILLIAAALAFGFQFLAQASWAEGIRVSAASTPPEVGSAPATFVEFLTALATSTVRLAILIGIPFAITSAVLKRNQTSQGK